MGNHINKQQSPFAAGTTVTFALLSFGLLIWLAEVLPGDYQLSKDFKFCFNGVASIYLWR